MPVIIVASGGLFFIWRRIRYHQHPLRTVILSPTSGAAVGGCFGICDALEDDPLFAQAMAQPSRGISGDKFGWQATPGTMEPSAVIEKRRYSQWPYDRVGRS